MPDPKDEQRSQAEELEDEIESLSQSGKRSGSATLHEFAEAKAAEYRRRRESEAECSPEAEMERAPEGESEI